MVIVQNLLRFAQILFGARFNAPRQAQNPVHIVAHNRGLSGHRRHVLKLFQLRIDLLAGLSGQLGLHNPTFKFSDLVLAVFTIAQLLLNGLHLLIQIILALGAFHLGFDAGFDLFLDLQHRHFALHQTIHFFQPLGHR